jgi:hypothetical protein
MRAFCLILGCVSLICASTVAVASLQEKKFIREQEQLLASAFEGRTKVSEECGISPIKLSIEWESFKAATEPAWDDMVNPKPNIGKIRVAGFCAGVVEPIRRICRDDLGKEAMKVIKTFTCHFSKDEKLVVTKGADGAEGGIEFWTDLKAEPREVDVYGELMNQL